MCGVLDNGVLVGEDILSDKDKLVEALASFTHDPLGYVRFAFPWGEGDLKAPYDRPEDWQIEILTYIGERLRAGTMTAGQALMVVLTAVASGHGIGKSALVAWIIKWGMATCVDTRGVVTANTDSQLRTKTWPELAKWHNCAIDKGMFVLTASAFYSAERDHDRTWRIDIIPWSENNTEAFAGLHNKKKRVLLIFDEASAIADKIWEVAEGAMTDEDTEIIWAVFGNPTRGNGRFHDCFHKYRHRWKNIHVDSRSVRITNKVKIQQWIDDYGENSDFVKVRVKGWFPSISESQFIGQDIVDAAKGRKLSEKQYGFAPKILTLDNAWTGTNEAVIFLRQGLASVMKAAFSKSDDDMKTAGVLGRYEDEEKTDAVFIDVGYGQGVYSAGKQLGRKWMLIYFGGASPDPQYLNLRAYMWGMMKQWLREGGAIPNDPVLCEQLTAPEMYVIATGPNAGKKKLESKEEMKARGIDDVGRADALALSFGAKVMNSGRQWNSTKSSGEIDIYEIYEKKKKQKREYDPYKEFA